MTGAGVPLRELGLVLLVAAAITYLATGPVRSLLVRTGRAVSYTHLTLPTTLHECRSRWSPYH